MSVPMVAARRLGAVAGALVGVALAGPGPPAWGQEGRTVAGVELSVGWGDEPAYVGVNNSVQVTATEAGGGAPVTGLGGCLQVEVTKGWSR